MASLSTLIIFALALTCFYLAPCYSRKIARAEYFTVDVCDEICRLHPEAICKLDCLALPADDCINHHYYKNGTIEYHCDWD